MRQLLQLTSHVRHLFEIASAYVLLGQLVFETHVDVNEFKNVLDVHDKHVNELVTHVRHGDVHDVQIFKESV